MGVRESWRALVGGASAVSVSGYPATHGHDHAADALTLFIPHGRDGFISPVSTVRLPPLLILLHHHLFGQRSLDTASSLVRLFRCPRGRVTLLHVGNPQERPLARVPGRRVIPQGWTLVPIQSWVGST
jgi:hypothetical protein